MVSSLFTRNKLETMNEEQRRRIEENDIELERMRQELGIRPRMSIVRMSTTPTESTFNLRDLNKELINNKQ